ncbi:MAG: hypothetical protein ACYC2U_08650, partial [Candidatus Amoebophilus sp.]
LPPYCPYDYIVFEVASFEDVHFLTFWLAQYNLPPLTTICNRADFLISFYRIYYGINECKMSV